MFSNHSRSSSCMIRGSAIYRELVREGQMSEGPNILARGLTPLLCVQSFMVSDLMLIQQNKFY